MERPLCMVCDNKYLAYTHVGYIDFESGDVTRTDACIHCIEDLRRDHLVYLFSPYHNRVD